MIWRRRRVLRWLTPLFAAAAIAAPSAHARPAEGVGPGTAAADPAASVGPVETIAAPSAFSWSDAGIGVAVAAGALLAAGAGLGMARHYRRLAPS
jgi:hypothetical protein